MEGVMTLLCNRVSIATSNIVPACALLLLLRVNVHLTAQGPGSKVITIADGTPVHLYLMDDITSKTNKVGDTVHFKVREGVEVSGVLVISAGSAVVGRVVAIGRSRLMGHSGGIALSIESAAAVNGAKIHLRGEASAKGGSRGATTWESAAWFGPDAYIHKGTMLNAYVDGNQTVSLMDGGMPK
jgi:hypothetical protein